MAEFMIKSKVLMAIKISLFITKYRRELRMEADIKRKEKVKRVTELVERMKKVWEEVGVVQRKTQEKIKI